MQLRHADSLAKAIAADPDLPQTAMACRTIARFVIDAYALARDAADPRAAVDKIFQMIEAAWEVTGPDRTAHKTVRSSSPGPEHSGADARQLPN